DRPPRTAAVLFPLRRENIELVTKLRVLVGGEHDSFSIRRKLGKSGEAAEVGHLLQTRAVGVDQIKLKLASIASMLIRRKQNLLSVRCEGGRKTRASEVGNLLCVLSVGIRHEQLHLHGRCQILA